MNFKFLNIRNIIGIIFVLFFTAFTMNPVRYENTITRKSLTVGYMKNLFNEVDLNDAKAAIKVWVNEIVKIYYPTSEYNIKAKIYNSISEVKESMRADSLALLSMNTYDYLKYGNEIGVDAQLAASAEGDIYGQYYILVRNDSKFKNIKDLKGANIGVISATNHIASRIWLDVILAKNNIPDKSKYFQSITGVNKESQLILSLFFGHLDACIVSTGALQIMRELNPQIKEKIIPIGTSAKYLWGVLCFTRTYTDEQERKSFYANSVHIQELVTGKQLFSLIKIEKVVPFKNQYLDSYKELLKEYSNLVKSRKIKGNDLN